MANPAHIAAHAARQENVCAAQIMALSSWASRWDHRGWRGVVWRPAIRRTTPCGDEGGDGVVLVGDDYGHKEEDAYPKAKEEAAEV